MEYIKIFRNFLEDNYEKDSHERVVHKIYINKLCRVLLFLPILFFVLFPISNIVLWIFKASAFVQYISTYLPYAYNSGISGFQYFSINVLCIVFFAYYCFLFGLIDNFISSTPLQKMNILIGDMLAIDFVILMYNPLPFKVLGAFAPWCVIGLIILLKSYK